MERYFGEVSDGNENLLIDNGDVCHRNLAELCSCSGVLWEVEIASDEIGYATEEGSKQSVKGVVWFLLTAYSKT